MGWRFLIFWSYRQNWFQMFYSFASKFFKGFCMGDVSRTLQCWIMASWRGYYLNLCVLSSFYLTIHMSIELLIRCADLCIKNQRHESLCVPFGFCGINFSITSEHYLEQLEHLTRKSNWIIEVLDIRYEKILIRSDT